MFRIMILIGIAGLVVGCTASRGSRRTAAGSSEASQPAWEAPVDFADDIISRPDDRLIEIEADMNISAIDLVAVVDSLYSLVERFNGYVYASTLAGLDFCVPADCLTDFFRAAERLGKVTSRYVTTTDVTESAAAAINSREKNEAARKRFLELMTRAETVEEIIEVERELDRINKQINDLDELQQTSDHKQKYAFVEVQVWAMPSAKPGPVGFVFYQIYRGAKWLFVR